MTKSYISKSAILCSVYNSIVLHSCWNFTKERTEENIVSYISFPNSEWIFWKNGTEGLC